MSSVLPPVIFEPIFEGQSRIQVHSVESGSTVSVWTGAQLLAELQAAGGAVVLRTDRPLVAGEVITATATKAGVTSPSSQPVEAQRLPVPLPTPTFTGGPTLYIGAECVGASGSVPDADISAWNAGDVLGREPAGYYGRAIVRLNRPLTDADSIHLAAEDLGNHSGESQAVAPIKPIGEPPYEEELPPPVVQPPLLECQNLARLTGLLIGAQYEIYDSGKKVFGPACATETGANSVLGATLAAGESVTARQAIPARNLESALSAPQAVKAIEAPPAPVMEDPLYQGAGTVHVYKLLACVKVEIAIDGATVGAVDYDPSGEFGVPALVAGQKVKARQALCGRWSLWSEEVTVQPVPGRVDSPKLEKPLYPCANLVRVADSLPWALVRVYADGIFVGKGHGRLIGVVPHLAAKQQITATQTVGNLTSKPCQPVTVEVPPERLPAPTIAGAIEGYNSPGPGQIIAFAPGLAVHGLLPGALVSVYSKNLLVGAVEATDADLFMVLSLEPWPGTSVHARQSLCGRASVDSNNLVAVGVLTIVPPVSGKYNPPHLVSGGPATVSLTVVSGRWYDKKYPAVKDTTVSLATSDSGVVKVLGTGHSVITAGLTTTNFQAQILNPGVATLKATADNYQPASIELEGWGEVWFEDSAGNTQARVLKMTVGDSLDLKVFAKPVPSNGKIQLQSEHGFVSVPAEITIPPGQAFGVAKVTAVAPGQQYDEIVCKTPHYGTSGFTDATAIFSVDPKPAPPPPRSPFVKQGFTLWNNGICADYDQDKFGPSFGKFKGVIREIENLSQHKLKVYRTEPVIGSVIWEIESGKKASNLSLSSTDVLNGWNAEILEDIQCVWAPLYVTISVSYEPTK